MVLIYPLLVASNINPNIIPGVVKALERYLIIYQLDHIMVASKNLAGLTLAKHGKFLVNIKEDETEAISTVLAREMLMEAAAGLPAPTTKNQPIPQSSTQQNYGGGGGRDPKEDKPKADASVSVDKFQDIKSLSLEPTWVKIDRVAPPPKGGKGEHIRYSDIIGIKVLPVLVKSDAKLVHLLTYDANVIKITRELIKFGRSIEVIVGKILARISGFFNKYTKGLIGKRYGSATPVTGDPYKDVIIKKSFWTFRSAETATLDAVFVMTNLADFKENFFDKPKKIMDLRKMGWGSIIIADDINKRISFCMKPFSGMCSNMPYSVLFQSFDQYEVYKDLEEVKRSSASIFKIGARPMHKILGESRALKKIEEFSADMASKKIRKRMPIMEETEILGENLFTFARKTETMGASTFKAYMRTLAEDPDKLTPGIFGTEKFIMKIGRRMDPNFLKAYEFSKRVYKNTIRDTDPEILDKLALITTVWASMASGTKKTGIAMSKLKEIILEIVRKYRERKRRKVMSGEAMPAEYKGSFAAATFFVSFMFMACLIVLYWAITNVFGMFQTSADIADAVSKMFSGAKDELPSEIKEPAEKIVKSTMEFWTFVKKLIMEIIPEPMIGSLQSLYNETLEVISKFEMATMTLLQKMIVLFTAAWTIKWFFALGKKPTTYRAAAGGEEIIDKKSDRNEEEQTGKTWVSTR